MNDLKRKYLKKAVLFPAVVVIVLLIISYFTIPTIISLIPTNTDKTQAVTEYNESDYYLVKYEKFSDLRLNNFAGWLSSDDVGLGCAVTYKSEKEYTDASSLWEKSTEPWNNGCVIITGENTDVEFRNLHKATLGNKVTVDFYGHDSYTYSISQIVTNKSLEEIDEYIADDTLIMCLPYNDFTDFGNSYFYTVYVAELVK